MTLATLDGAGLQQQPSGAPHARKRRLVFPLLLLTLLFLCSCERKRTPNAAVVATGAVKIDVLEDGFYEIEEAALRQAGLEVAGWSLADLHLSQGGTAVPFLLDENRLLFYGLASTDRYVASRTYVLQAGEAGLGLAERAAIPAVSGSKVPVRRRLHLEEERLYSPDSLDRNGGDPWLWQKLGQGQQTSIAIPLTGIGDDPATLRLHFWGVTHNPQVENDHDLDLILNDHHLGTLRWEGQTGYTGQVDIAGGVLKEGENRLLMDNKVAGAAFLDIMELDWVELEYLAAPVAVDDRLVFLGSGDDVVLSGFSRRPLLFDISDGGQPALLTGWEYSQAGANLNVADGQIVAAIGPEGYLSPSRIAPLRRSEWRDPQKQADLIIIITSAVATELAPLVEAREGQGITTALVDVEEIYDTFGYGAATPASIQQFVKYAYESWREPRPRYLLLVGDATSDYRDYLGLAPANLIPSPMVAVEYGGETVSDARLADVDGDMRPELAVGRWPVTTAVQVRSLVERTLAYEGGHAASQAIFAVDGSDGQFASIANRIAPASSLPEAETRILVGVDSGAVTEAWNQGTWLATYIGHGSLQQWGKDGLFTAEAIGDLRANTPPIVLQMTCLTGLFAHPKLASLSESMLLHDRGPVLIVAATSLTLSAHQEPFALGMLQQLQNVELDRMGDAFQHAKRALDVAGNNGLREISDTYLLLGDPSALIVRPRP